MAAIEPEQGVPRLGWHAGSTIGMDLFLHWVIAVSAFCGPCPGDLITSDWDVPRESFTQVLQVLAEAVGPGCSPPLWLHTQDGAHR